ncbi:hypothetical protein [Pseudomonas anguilliseptica]|uniref:hypothetical protein n=1 Tax=Pseudomonas anguilliseptica TaxID=53406 RepID=UPI001114EE72|nr:hypothetical protein [Pseudomonas anguilliseptica]
MAVELKRLFGRIFHARTIDFGWRLDYPEHSPKQVLAQGLCMRTTCRAPAVLVLFALSVLTPLAVADSQRVVYFDLPLHTPLPE